MNNSKWIIFGSISLMFLTMNIDMSGVPIATPNIAADLGSSLDTLQWIVNIYAIAAASFVMVGGCLGDFWGRPKTYIVGLIVFAIASLGIGLAPSSGVIIAFRALQGLGAAICWPLGVVLIKNAFPKNQQGFAMGITAMVMGVSMSIGPPVVGLLLHVFDWRYVFLINVPLSTIALIIGRPILKERFASQKVSSTTIASGLFLMIGIGALMFANNGLSSTTPWIHHLLIPTFIASIILILVFILCQKHMKKPLLNLALFHNRSFNLYILIRFGWQTTWFTLLFVFSILLQNTLGLPALHASLILLALPVTFAITSPLSGRLYNMLGPRKLICLGLAMTLLSFILLVQLRLNSSMAYVMVGLAINGLGLGIGFPNLLTASLKSIPSQFNGMAGGALYTALYLGTAFGTSLCSFIIHHVSYHKLSGSTASWLKHISPLQHKVLVETTTGASNIAHLHRYFQPPQLQWATQFSKNAFMTSFHQLMQLSLVIIIVLIIAALFTSSRIVED